VNRPSVGVQTRGAGSNAHSPDSHTWLGFYELCCHELISDPLHTWICQQRRLCPDPGPGYGSLCHCRVLGHEAGAMTGHEGP
jgi:hypothetical protein